MAAAGTRTGRPNDLRNTADLPSLDAVDRLSPDELPAFFLQLAALQTRAAARLTTAPERAREVSPDELVTVEEAAKRLGVSTDWLYRRAHALPFARRLSARALRFSARGIERWIRQTR